MIYILLPFLAWVIAGCCKFAVNTLRHGRGAKRLIGYGGFPSTHTTVLSSVVFFAGFQLGWQSPVCTLGLGTLVILIIDAHGLRRKVGEQAAVLNRLQQKVDPEHVTLLRERMGHSWLEIGGGLTLGAFLSWLACCFC